MATKDDLWLGVLNHVTLVTITLSDPDTARDSSYTTDPGASPVLRFCDGDKPYTYDSNVYYPHILSWSGRTATTAFTAELGDADGDLVLATGRIPWQKKGAAAPQETAEYTVRLPQIMRSYVMQGAPIVVTVICERANGQTEHPVCHGQVDEVNIDEKAMHLTVVEDKEYNRSKPDTDGPADGSSSTRMVINKVDHPNAPPSSLGKSIPIIYTGVVSTVEQQGGLANSPLYMNNLWPCVVKDTLYNSTDRRVGSVAVAGYPSQNSPTSAYQDLMFLWLPSLNTLAKLSDSGSYGQVDGYHADYWPKTYADADTQAIVYLNPTTMVNKTSGVTDAGKAFDGRHDTYADLTHSGSTVTLDLRIPYPPSQGRIMASRAFVLLEVGTGAGATAGTVNGTFGIWSPDASPAEWHGGNVMYKDITKAQVNTGGYYETAALGSGYYEKDPWAGWRWEGKDTSGNRMDLYFRFNVTQSGATVKVVACGLKVTFLPQMIQQHNQKKPIDRRLWSRGRKTVAAEGLPEDAAFYCGGYEMTKDNAGADITGVAGDAIADPVFIFKHFWWKIAAEGVGSSTHFTSSGFGSFATAQTDIVAKSAVGYYGVYRILSPESPDEMRQRLARHAPVTFYRSQLDNKWRAIVYQQSPSSDKYYTDPSGNNYKWRYTTDMLDGSVGVSFTPLSECVNEVHVKFGLFAPTGQYTGDSWVGPSGSDDGDGSRDTTREALAVDSRDDYNVKGVMTVESDYITHWDIATALRDYLFDRYRRPRLVLKFRTGPKGIALEPGMVTLIDNELQDYIPVPWYPGNGSAKEWDDIKFFVRSNSLVSGAEAGGMPFMCDITLEEIA